MLSTTMLLTIMLLWNSATGSTVAHMPAHDILS